MKQIGIYKIVDLEGRTYIGSSNDIRKRKVQHFRHLKNGSHHNQKLQHYYNKHKGVGLSFTTIELCKQDELINREQYYIDTIKPWYNISLIAGRPPYQTGWKHTEETLHKIRAFRSTEKGREMQRQNSLKCTVHPFLGKTHTKEWRDKMSLVHKNKIVSEETKEKLRVSNTGKKASIETKQKMSVSQTGRKHSTESIEKMKLIAAERSRRPDWSEKMRQNSLKRYNRA